MATLAEVLASQGVSLADPMSIPKKTAGKQKTRFAQADARNLANISWVDPDLAKIGLLISGATAGESEIRDGNSWIPINFRDIVEEVAIMAQVRANEGILVGRAVGKNLENYTGKPGLPAFRIKVGRKPDGTIHTFHRKKDGQNDFRIDLVRLADGLVVVLEISFVIRDGQCWICLQETFVGQHVWLTEAECELFPKRVVAHNLGDLKTWVTVVPAESVYAHRYANPFTVYQECEALLKLALEHKCSMVAFGDLTERPTWTPVWPTTSEAPQKIRGAGNWLPAVVAWFNLALGYGFAITKDNEGVFIHFANIRLANGKKPSEHGELALLHPMQKIFLKLEDPNGTPNRLKASIICAVN